MIVKGVVISIEVDVQVAKKDGGSYPGSRLTYRTEEGKIQDQAFHNNAFKFNAGLKTQLTNLVAGQTISIDKVKDGDFWKVNSILPWEKTENAAPTYTSAGTAKPTTSPKSTYETPEERAKKQVYIVRQSSITAAIGVGKKNVADVIATAKEFEAYVFSDETPSKVVELKGDEEDVF